MGVVESVPPSSSLVVSGEEPLEGCVSFMIASNVFLRLIQSEVVLMEGVVPHTHHAHVLDSLIKSPVDFFMSKGEALLLLARKGVAHNEHAIVLSCLRLLRHVKGLLPQYRVLLRVRKQLPCSVRVMWWSCDDMTCEACPVATWCLSHECGGHTLMMIVCFVARSCSRSRWTGLCISCSSLTDW